MIRDSRSRSPRRHPSRTSVAAIPTASLVSSAMSASLDGTDDLDLVPRLHLCRRPLAARDHLAIAGNRHPPSPPTLDEVGDARVPPERAALTVEERFDG